MRALLQRDIISRDDTGKERPETRAEEHVPYSSPTAPGAQIRGSDDADKCHPPRLRTSSSETCRN